MESQLSRLLHETSGLDRVGISAQDRARVHVALTWTEVGLAEAAPAGVALREPHAAVRKNGRVKACAPVLEPVSVPSQVVLTAIDPRAANDRGPRNRRGSRAIRVEHQVPLSHRARKAPRAEHEEHTVEVRVARPRGRLVHGSTRRQLGRPQLSGRSHPRWLDGDRFGRLLDGSHVDRARCPVLSNILLTVESDARRGSRDGARSRGAPDEHDRQHEDERPSHAVSLRARSEVCRSSERERIGEGSRRCGRSGIGRLSTGVLALFPCGASAARVACARRRRGREATDGRWRSTPDRRPHHAKCRVFFGRNAACPSHRGRSK